MQLDVQSDDRKTFTPVGPSNPLPITLMSDSSGAPMPSPESYVQSFTRNGDGTIATISFTDGTHTWTQTFTYTAGVLSSVSAWVRS